MKLKFDEPLSSFAFKFNLRRYSTELSGAASGFVTATFAFTEGGAVQPVETRVDRA